MPYYLAGFSIYKCMVRSKNHQEMITIVSTFKFPNLTFREILILQTTRGSKASTYPELCASAPSGFLSCKLGRRHLSSGKPGDLGWSHFHIHMPLPSSSAMVPSAVCPSFRETCMLVITVVGSSNSSQSACITICFMARLPSNSSSDHY